MDHLLSSLKSQQLCYLAYAQTTGERPVLARAGGSTVAVEEGDFPSKRSDRRRARADEVQELPAMSVPVEEAIAALSTFSLEDDQPDLQGLAVLLSTERCATNSPIEYGDVSAYRLSLTEDTKSINQLVL
ncbi:hypothetical protein Taro_013739 [Colocasia esculenta]|uniref:Uncharacterized protein n=1 Tax=Colocasia esculenta TaxID=4460 RepID=A0A843UN29_COLES|nr:hypothetical protein [Colocasia esculenta]